VVHCFTVALQGLKAVASCAAPELGGRVLGRRCYLVAVWRKGRREDDLRVTHFRAPPRRRHALAGAGVEDVDAVCLRGKAARNAGLHQGEVHVAEGAQALERLVGREQVHAQEQMQPGPSEGLDWQSRQKL
jgi:hypothetical protein